VPAKFNEASDIARFLRCIVKFPVHELMECAITVAQIVYHIRVHVVMVFYRLIASKGLQ